MKPLLEAVLMAARPTNYCEAQRASFRPMKFLPCSRASFCKTGRRCLSLPHCDMPEGWDGGQMDGLRG